MQYIGTYIKVVYNTVFVERNETNHLGGKIPSSTYLVIFPFVMIFRKREDNDINLQNV
jgi:hypothetical protein